MLQEPRKAVVQLCSLLLQHLTAVFCPSLTVMTTPTAPGAAVQLGNSTSRGEVAGVNVMQAPEREA